MSHKNVLQIALLLALSWLWMMIVHESGHVLLGVLTGGKIAKVVLHPLELSRTDLSFNPHPLAVAWGGPAFGCVLPLLLWAAWKFASARGLQLVQWFSGFCLIANGVYIGSGAFPRIGDAEEMLSHGSEAWILIVFGVVTIPAGFLLWNGLGKRFGIGEHAETASTSAILTCAVLLLATVAGELVATAVSS